MKRRLLLVCSAAIIALTWGTVYTRTVVRPPTGSATLRAFSARLAEAREHLPQIVAAAQAAAARKVEHPEALLNVPYNLQPTFAEEMLNRSGGLAEALPSDERKELITDYDIVVLSVRSWETDGPQALEYLKTCRQRGWMTILFASQAGKPQDLQVDFLIDNGAANGKEDHAAVNSIANALNGWLWVCEYTSALTRAGKHPGILQSITTAGSNKHNRIYQSRRTRHNIYPCEVAVPAEDLARIYLRRADKLVEDLSSVRIQNQIATAADLIAKRIKSRRQVYVSTNTHIMLSEIDKNNQTPWKPLHALRNPDKVFPSQLQPGDLLFWLSFNGVSIWQYRNGPSEIYCDYDQAIRQSRADFITCFSTDPLHPANNGQGALAHIEQDWSFGDAEVIVPFPPGRIAPISGLYQAMIYRMLDEAAAERLKEN